MKFPENIQKFFGRGFHVKRNPKIFAHTSYREELKTQRDSRRNGYKDLEEVCKSNQRELIKKVVEG